MDLEIFDSLSYSDKAKLLMETKQRFGLTIAQLADRLNLSPTKTQRILSLYPLPDEVKRKVDEGVLPLEQPLKALARNTKKTQPRRKSILTERQYTTLEWLYQLKYLTIDQLSEYSDLAYSKAAESLAELKVFGYADAEIDFRPYAYSLSEKGANRLAVEPNKRWKSANAIHQELMRNQVELYMRKTNPSASFISRVECWSNGFYPSNGEHLLEVTKGDEVNLVLVLIDDYQMPPSRLLKSIERPHSPPKEYYPEESKRRYSDVVSQVFIFMTDKNRETYHKSFFRKVSSKIPCPVTHDIIPPIWRNI